MPSLPIPVITALVLGFLLLRMWLVDRRHGPLVGLLALCAVQSLIISLAQHYRVPGLSTVQPITATLIPPMAWIAFQITAIRSFRATDLVHLTGPVVAMVSLAVAPLFLDWLIPGLFVAYGGAILRRGMQGPDALPRMRIDGGDLPGRIWQLMGAALIASAFSDVFIVAAQMLGAAHLQPWIISLYSAGTLLLLGGLSLSNALVTGQPEPEEEPAAPEVSEQDRDIAARLHTLMADQKPYLNPDLTLSQLSRRMRIPVKQLSTAINRVTGENVSRYINTARIRAAQTALTNGENVTNAMLSSGFNTKSNFNREFLRIVGQSPSDWLASRQHEPPSSS